jgi:hypothetical protein
MKRRQTKEKFIKDCKTIGYNIQKMYDELGYYPTYREIGYKLKTTYTTAYNLVQTAISHNWLPVGMDNHYGRKTK